jgi:hypothetical protein
MLPRVRTARPEKMLTWFNSSCNKLSASMVMGLLRSAFSADAATGTMANTSAMEREANEVKARILLN